MNFIEKKKIEVFFNTIISQIEKDMHSYSHVSTVCHNAKIEFEEFLNDDLSYKSIKCFNLKEPK